MNRKKKIGAIIQTRMGSTRLPGKVMLDLYGKPVIQHVIDRVLESRYMDIIVIATTVSSRDGVVVDAVKGYHPRVAVFRGSEDDVLDRYFQAAGSFQIDTIVRITSDCPLIDPHVSDDVIDSFFSENYDYVSNIGKRTYPRGLDTEVFSFSALERAWRDAKLLEEREHVTPYIRNHSEIFKIGEVNSPDDYSDYRWTLDTEDDWQFIKAVYSNLYQCESNFTWDSVLDLVKNRPELSLINAHVEQKA